MILMAACSHNITHYPCKGVALQIQDVMVDYFRKREGPMAKDDISALQKSLAAIYYLPFQCGVNLYFCFSGAQLCLIRFAIRHPCLAHRLSYSHSRLPITGLTHPAMPTWLEVCC